MLIPDTWKLIEATVEGQTFHVVLSGFYGGYLDGDAWRLSTKITSKVKNDDHYIATTMSGTEYKLYFDDEGFSGLSSSVYNRFKSKFGEDRFKAVNAQDIA